MEKLATGAPKWIYVLCALLAIAFSIVAFDLHTDLAKTLCFLLFPLSATPFALWLVEKEAQEPEQYFHEMYGGFVWLKWVVRFVIMVVVAAMCFWVVLLVLGAVGLIVQLFT